MRHLETHGLPKDLSPAKPTTAYNTFWQFAAERQAIFFRKYRGGSPPWTKDPILQRNKFTNAYRAADRTSQYLIRNVIYSDNYKTTDTFFRIMLFKLFNKIDTWELLQSRLGAIMYSEQILKQCKRILSGAIVSKCPILSSAYMMTTIHRGLGVQKHIHILNVLGLMMGDELPLRIRDCKSMAQAFDLLRSYPMIGDFLAYQYITDVNYSTMTNYSEMEYSVAGPGARHGIALCFHSLGGLTELQIIKMMAERQGHEFRRLGLPFETLWGRSLQLIDIQNLFCEFDKYTKCVEQKSKGKTRLYKPRTDRIKYWFPPKWKLNARMDADRWSASNYMGCGV